MILSTHRRMMVIDGLSTVLMMHAGRLGAVCAYLLRATFDADDQGFADGQVLDTDAEGVQDGQLTVVELDGTLAIVGNQCAFTAQGTPTWGDLALVGETSGGGAFSRALGLGVAITQELQTAKKHTHQGWFKAANGVAASRHQALGPDQSGNLWAVSSLFANIEIGTYAADVEYEAWIVLGGYDVNGVPWHSGEAAANYLYGASYFIKGGGYTDWALLWRSEKGNLANVYANWANYEGVGTLNNFRVPDADLSAVLQPLVKDTFTDANGTSLDAHTPDVDDVGGGWAVNAGTWQVQGNQAKCTVAAGGGGQEGSTLDAGEADVLVAGDLTLGTGSAGLRLRYTDENHFWLVVVHPTGPQVRLYERNVGWTERAAGGIVYGAGKRMVAIADGQDITCFYDGGSRITYGSAALNETETRHGVHAGGVNGVVDNFHAHARRAAVYDTTLDLC